MGRGSWLWPLALVGVAVAVGLVPEMHSTWAGLLAVLVLLVVMGALLQRRRTVADTAALQARVDSLGERLAAGALRTPQDPGLAQVADSLDAAVGSLRESLRAAQAQARRLQDILDGMPEGVVALDSLGRVLAINPAAASTLGVDADEAQGRSLAQLTEDPGVRALAMEALVPTAARTEGTPEQPERHASVELKVGARGEATGPLSPGGRDAADPGTRVFKARGTTLRGAEGREVSAVIVLSDITLLRRLETVRRDFVANVSHELKTPITAILGFTETLQDDGCADAQQAQRFLDIVHRHAQRLDRMVEDLLLLARVDGEDTERAVPPEPTPLKPLLAEVQAGCAPLAAELEATVQVSCPANLTVRAKPGLLVHAVSNLVHNAIRHGGPKATVEVTALPEPGQTIIRVRDHGAGVPQAQRERIFERFTRGEQPTGKADGGTGLGLAIVRRIARALGGEVSVRDAPGGGALFALRLPGAPPPPPSGEPHGV